MKFAYVAVVSALFLPQIATAEQIKFNCKVANNVGIGGIPAEILLVRDTETGDVQVIDGLIQTVFGKPIAGKVATDNAKRTTFAWTLKQYKNEAGQYATLDYRLTIQKADRSATISMTPRGYSNTFHAAGKCKIGG